MCAVGLLAVLCHSRHQRLLNRWYLFDGIFQVGQVLVLPVERSGLEIFLPDFDRGILRESCQIELDL